MDFEKFSTEPITIEPDSSSSSSITTTATTEMTKTATTTTANLCVLASTLSATSVIVVIVICGLIYFFYIRKKLLRPSPHKPNLSKKQTNHGNYGNDNADSLFNYGYQPDQEYKVPPKRDEPLPRKFGEKEREIRSPYHTSHINDEDYVVPPVRNKHVVCEPPLPPNLRKKNEIEKQTKSQTDSNAYYLDMECINNDSYKNNLYENVAASADDIYVNN